VPDPPVFVYDQNFPMPIMRHIIVPGLTLRPLKDIHPDLIADHDDWEVMRELRVRGGVDGWITLDRKMLNLEKEMVVLHQSRLSLVVFEGAGNDPLIATGMLLTHVTVIAKQTNPRQAQLSHLRRSPTKPPENPWARIEQIAAREKVSAQTLYDRNKLPARLFLRRL
jgi:hypothetical protein